MITKIGVVAGDIWNYLEGHDREAVLEDVIDAVKKDRDLVMMSIGWLAREGHVSVDGEGPDYTINLTNMGGKE